MSDEDFEDIIKELESKLAKALLALAECQEEIDGYIRSEYPSEHSVHQRLRDRAFSANPARIALEILNEEKNDESD